MLKTEYCTYIPQNLPVIDDDYDLLSLAAMDYKTYMNTYMQYKRKLGLYASSTFTQSSLQVALKVRECIRYEKILRLVCASANCWIFHRASQPGY